tara:strand:- start:73 stop:1275 length:1203 start_codon:yes stop_codon:yes gene_type:complete
MRRATPELWLKLGEARSKCSHLAGVPLLPQVAKDLHAVFLAKGVHATTAIEGNTLSEDQVMQLLKKEEVRDGVADYAKNEVRNILDAANLMLEEIERDGPKPLTVAEIKDYNRLVLRDLVVEDHVLPGEFTPVQVGVPGYRGAPPQECPDLVQKLCDWLNGPTFAPEDQEELGLAYGLIKAVMAHLYLVWIHPFGDGNGRTARLLEVRILLEAGVPSAAAHLLSNHYNHTRPEYIRQLADASRNGGNVIPFIQYAVAGFVTQIRDQIETIKAQQWEVSWVNYIHEQFMTLDGAASKRRRDLVLELSKQKGFVPRREIRNLSAKVATHYAGKTARTVDRDLTEVVAMGLVERTDQGVRALKETVLQFLPRGRRGEKSAQLKKASELNEVNHQLSLDLLQPA